MKTLKLIAVAAVLTFGIGGAVTASMMADEPANVMNIAEPDQPEEWVTIEPGHKGCDNSDLDRRCTGYRPNLGAQVQDRAFGYRIP